MKFLMETSRELSFAELLRLNGGYGGGSGGSPGKSGSGSYGGSGSGGRYSKSGTRSKGAARKSSRAYSAPSGSLWYLNDERLTVVDGRAYSSLTGFISGGAGSSEADSKEPAKTPQQIADEARKAADKAQGAVDKMDPVSAKKHYIDMGFDSAMAAVLALDDRGELNSNFLRNDETYLVHQIVKKLNSDLKNGNIDYKVGEMQCDDYVQSVLGRPESIITSILRARRRRRRAPSISTIWTRMENMTPRLSRRALSMSALWAAARSPSTAPY